jgi:hypothetical protein
MRDTPDKGCERDIGASLQRYDGLSNTLRSHQRLNDTLLILNFTTIDGASIEPRPPYFS